MCHDFLTNICSDVMKCILVALLLVFMSMMLNADQEALCVLTREILIPLSAAINQLHGTENILAMKFSSRKQPVMHKCTC